MIYLRKPPLVGSSSGTGAIWIAFFSLSYGKNSRVKTKKADNLGAPPVPGGRNAAGIVDAPESVVLRHGV